MTASNDFDRQLLAYLEAAGPSDVRSEVVVSALDTARGQRQRRGLAAWATGPGTWPVFAGRLSLRRLSPVLRLGIVAAITLALIAGSVFVGSRLLADADPFPSRTQFNGTFQSVGGTSGEGEYRPWSVAVLPDGRVVVARWVQTVIGDDWAPTRIEAMDPATGTVQDLGVALKPRYGPTVVALRDGRVLLIGGDITPPIGGGESGSFSFAPATAEVFDPLTGTSVITGPHSGAALGFAATLPDGRVLAAGGVMAPTGRQELATAEIFDPATNAWTSAAPMTRGASSLAATHLSDGRLLLVQVSTWDPNRSTHIEVYDPATGAFSAAGELTRPAAAAGVLLDDGRVLFAHGVCLDQDPDTFKRFPGSLSRGATFGFDPVSTEIFDPADGSVRDGPALPHCVDTATALPDGLVLITAHWQEGQQRRRGSSLTKIGWAGLLDPHAGSVRIVDGPDRYGAVPAVLPDGSVAFVGGTPLRGDAATFSWGQIFR